MLAEISAGLGSLKAAKDIVQSLNAVKTDAAINGVMIELQGLILDAQQGLFAAQEAKSADARRIAELEQEIMRLKDWAAERERYQLTSVSSGVFTYMQKPEMRGPEPAHWLCVNCFDRGQKSVLQNRSRDVTNRYAIYSCTICKSEVRVHYANKPTYEDGGADTPEPPSPGISSVKLTRG
jgi:hypothetical protein